MVPWERPWPATWRAWCRMSAETWAIVAAGGMSRRMGEGMPKQFRPLGGVPMYAWSVQSLREWGAQVVLVVPPPWLDRVEAPAGVVAAVVPGGPRRQDSVAHGLRAVPPQAEWVLVHDAARPFLPHSLLGRLREAMGASAVVVPALPVVDTLKRSGDGARVGETVDRRDLWAAQTPQAFRREVLVRASTWEGEVTDEAAAVERMGVTPVLVPGSPFTFKVTTRDDMVLAEVVAQWLLTEGRHHEDWMWVRRAPIG